MRPHFKAALVVLPVIAAFGFLLFSPLKAWAAVSPGCDAPYQPGVTPDYPETDNLIENIHAAPLDQKQALDACRYANGAHSYGMMWIEPETFSAGSGVVAVTEWTAQVTFSGTSEGCNHLYITGVSINGVSGGITVDKNGELGTAANGACTNPGHSTGVSHAATIDTTRMHAGQNQYCISFEMDRTITPLQQSSGFWCSNIYLNVDSDVHPHIYGAPGTPGWAASSCIGSNSCPTINPGTYGLRVSIQNLGTGDSDDPEVIEVNTPAGVTPPAGAGWDICCGGSGAPGQFGNSNGNSFYKAYGYNNGCGVDDKGHQSPVCNQPHWFWRTSTIQAGGYWSGEGGFDFTIPSNVPDGQNICFIAYGWPVNYERNPAYNQDGYYCWQVSNPRYPFISTAWGDVHAGGAPRLGYNINCSGTQGSIQTKPEAGSNTKVTYVVSSGGSIAPPKPTNNYPGATLPLGYFGDTPGFGAYGQVCRPDIAKTVFQLVNGNYNSGTQLNNIPTNAVWQANGVVHIPASQINRRFTIYSNTDIYIDGDLTYSPSSVSRDLLPSLGIVTKGNIFISPNVKHLDGYYVANAAINTCDLPGHGSPTNVSQCQNGLQVSGLMMANNFHFYRTGTRNTVGPQDTEQIDFRADLYWVTPPGFSDYIVPKVNQLNYLPERPPLY